MVQSAGLAIQGLPSRPRSHWADRERPRGGRPSGLGLGIHGESFCRFLGFGVGV